MTGFGEGSRPDLSVVIPTLDDADALEALLKDLSVQQGVALEVIVVDGGSVDDTGERVARRAAAARCPIGLVSSPSGRGRQMNEGARLARAPDLLFLHADTRLPDERLLALAHAHMVGERLRNENARVAGHFPLRFDCPPERARLAYRFYEAKARLNRADCVNGDQGFWLTREWFCELGLFDEGLPFLEDARLAARVAEEGRWTLLPGSVTTSARRFEAEGLLRRQTLNALVRAFEALGEPSFAMAAPGLYRTQTGARRIDLYPFFERAHRIMASGGPSQALCRWLRVGAFARDQLWQVGLWLRERRESRADASPRGGTTSWVEVVLQEVDTLSDNAVGRIAGAVVAAGWFYGVLSSLWLNRRGFGVHPEMDDKPN